MEFLEWAVVFSKASPARRKEIYKLILESLKDFSEHGEGRADKSAGMELFRKFSDPNEYELVGISTGISYLRVFGTSQKELKARWIHPWGSPTLLLKHKRLPYMVEVNPGIRFGKSYLIEMPENKHAAEDVEGTTG